MTVRACDVFGEGPALVLVPGLGCDGRMWADVAGRLPEVFTYIIPRPWELSSIKEVSEVVLEALDVFGAEYSFIAGLSMGGYAVFETLREAWPHFDSAVIVDSTAYPDSPERREKRNQAIELAQSGKYGAVLAPFADSVIWKDGPGSKEARELLLLMARRVGPEGYARSVKAIRDREDYLSVLEKADVPMLFLSGEHDSLTPPALSVAMAKAARRGSAALIPSASHMTPLENPAAVAEALGDFFLTCSLRPGRGYEILHPLKTA